ncbi:unnamed protein product, partial [Dibothriocephalus latus]
MALDREGRVRVLGRHSGQRRHLRPLPVGADSSVSISADIVTRAKSGLCVSPPQDDDWPDQSGVRVPA